jgi:hypothetical protein
MYFFLTSLSCGGDAVSGFFDRIERMLQAISAFSAKRWEIQCLECLRLKKNWSIGKRLLVISMFVVSRQARNLVHADAKEVGP